MSESNPLTRRAASNLEAVKMDLAAAYTQGNDARTALLQTLLSCGGRILLYRPQLQHYAVLFGDLDSARYVALVVPGVGDGTNMCDDWIPGAMNLYVAAPDTAVVLWKGYDNPLDLIARGDRVDRVHGRPHDGGQRPRGVRRLARPVRGAEPDGGRPQFRIGGHRYGARPTTGCAAPTSSWPAAPA